MNKIPISLYGLVLLAPVVTVRAVAVTLIGSENAPGQSWALADDFESLSYYGTTWVSGVNYESTPISVLNGLGTLSLTSPSGGLAVYGAAPQGSGSPSASGIPLLSSDYPAFAVNGGFAGVGPSGIKALGANSEKSELLITFQQAVTDVGFYATGKNLMVSLFDMGGMPIDSPVGMIGLDNNLEFWGWESMEGIGSVKLTGDYIAFDRLLVQGNQIGGFITQPPSPPEVPEVAVVAPAMAALLVGAELVRRRRS